MANYLYVVMYALSVVAAYITTKNFFKSYVTFAEGAFALGWPLTFPVLTIFLAFVATLGGIIKAREKITAPAVMKEKQLMKKSPRPEAKKAEEEEYDI